MNALKEPTHLDTSLTNTDTTQLTLHTHNQADIVQTQTLPDEGSTPNTSSTAVTPNTSSTVVMPQSVPTSHTAECPIVKPQLTLQDSEVQCEGGTKRIAEPDSTSEHSKVDTGGGGMRRSKRTRRASIHDVEEMRRIASSMADTLKTNNPYTDELLAELPERQAQYLVSNLNKIYCD